MNWRIGTAPRSSACNAVMRPLWKGHDSLVADRDTGGLHDEIRQEECKTDQRLVRWRGLRAQRLA